MYVFLNVGRTYNVFSYGSSKHKDCVLMVKMTNVLLWPMAMEKYWNSQDVSYGLFLSLEATTLIFWIREIACCPVILNVLTVIWKLDFSMKLYLLVRVFLFVDTMTCKSRRSVLVQSSCCMKRTCNGPCPICLYLPDPSAWAECDTRSIFKQSLTGLN